MRVFVVNERKDDWSKVKLSVGTRLAYSVGHALNDLCASLWFSYLLLFLGSVLGFSNRLAGALMLLGQVADAVATPLIGIASDRSAFCQRYGRRKSWHLAGTVLVACSFPFVFQACLGPCQSEGPWVQFAYFATFIVVFQFGWAACQVAHVTLITDLTPDSGQRVELNAYRYSCTVASGVCIYAVTWMVLGIDGKVNQVGPDDAPLFRILALGVVCLGSVLAVFFHVLVKEPAATLPNEEGVLPIYRRRSCSVDIVLATHDAVPVVRSPIQTTMPTYDLTWRDWFSRVEFYQVALVYTSSRLYSNLFQMYTPLYLQHSLALPKQNVAVVPLVSYLSGFLSAFAVKHSAIRFGKKHVLFIGCLISLASCLWAEFGHGQAYTNWQVYVVGGLFGVGGTAMQVMTLALTADMIGQNKKSGAFVFGAMGFLDKLASGVAVVVAQELSPHDRFEGDVVSPYFRTVMTYGCGLAVIVTMMGLLGLLVRPPASSKLTPPDEVRTEVVKPCPPTKF